jgi:hypothetical protein
VFISWKNILTGRSVNSAEACFSGLLVSFLIGLFNVALSYFILVSEQVKKVFKINQLRL